MKREFLTPEQYRSANGVANSTLLTVANNPSDVIWLKNAPVDLTNRAAADVGTVVHTALLEPDLFESSVYVSSVAGRTTKTFSKEIQDNPDKIVITESEAQQIKLMQASGMAHPSFANVINAAKYKESSIFVTCPRTGLKLKIRPDIDAFETHGFLANLKTTSSLDDWRSDRFWINPLHKFNYAHDAAYSLYVASLFYGEECKTYKWPVLQKSVSLGRYPVGVFTISVSELESMGVVDEMFRNLNTYARCVDNNDWIHEESFPSFGDDLEITEIE